MALASCSVNQRLPSGPRISGWERAAFGHIASSFLSRSDEYFVAYLRASFVGGGFRGRVETLPDDDEQCRKVAPPLQIVQALAADLLPI
jgi:hypothetical protein